MRFRPARVEHRSIRDTSRVYFGDYRLDPAARAGRAISSRCALSRATFSPMLALLSATASVIGVLVLRQIPSVVETAGLVLVIGGVLLHRSRSQANAEAA